MIPKRLIFIEKEIDTAFMNLLNTGLPFEKWLESEEYETFALKLMDLRTYYIDHIPVDGRLLLHHTVMAAIWSPTLAMMEDMVYEDDKSKRQKLFETWLAIQGYVDKIIEEAQVADDLDD
ncbi:MAG: hypothetical protein Phog2KO_24670 [Phototrophicaceae bacterium]